jgi:hypothetical protein
MRYRLHTLLILLAVGPPLLAWTVPLFVDHLLRVRPAKEELKLLCAGDGMSRISFERRGLIPVGDIQSLEIEFQKAIAGEEPPVP